MDNCTCSPNVRRTEDLCPSCQEAFYLDMEEQCEDDFQPTEYEEWQDFHGGDDWDQGQYDEPDCPW